MACSTCSVYRLYILAAVHLNLTVALLHRACLSFVYDYRRNTKDRQIARPLLYAMDFTGFNITDYVTRSKEQAKVI